MNSTLYEIIREILMRSGPWAFSALVEEVKSQTGYQKELDYEYHVKKHVRDIESKFQVQFEEPLVIWDK